MSVVVGRIEFGEEIKIEPVRSSNSIEDIGILWRSLGINIGPAPDAPHIDTAELHHRNAETLRRLMRRTLPCS